MFVDLPRSVVCGVLVEWLRIDDLPKLDSAFCETARRLSYLELMSGPHMVNFSHNNDCPERTKLFMKWALLRKVRVCEFTIFRCLALVPQALQARVQEIAETAEFISESPYKPSRRSTISGSTASGNFYPNVFKSVLARSAATIRDLKIDLSQESAIPNVAYFSNIHCPKLHTIEFASTTTSRNVRNVCSAAPNLRMLKSAGHLTADALTELISGPPLPQLWYLDLSGSLSLTDSTLEALLIRSPRIAALNIAACPLLTYRAFDAVTTHCKHLTSFDASHLNVSDGVLCPVLLSCAGRLRILHLRGCKKLTHQCLLVIGESCLNLTSLDISHTCFIEQFIRDLVPQLPFITHFSCANTGVGDEILQIVAKNCPNIVSLNLAHCLWITPIGMYALIMRSKTLRTLHVHASSIASSATTVLTMLYNKDLVITSEPDLPPPTAPAPSPGSVRNRNCSQWFEPKSSDLRHHSNDAYSPKNASNRPPLPPKEKDSLSTIRKTKST